LEEALNVVSSQILFILLYFHLQYGLLVNVLSIDVRNWSARALGVGLVLLDGSMILRPDLVLPLVKRALHGIVRALTYAVTIPLLAALHVVTLPLARLEGRRSYRTRHPLTYVWVAGGPWRVKSTWQPKTSEAQQANTRRRPLLRLLGRVGSDGNYVMLAIALIVLLIASLNFLIYSPKLAPFIYTLF
jgi:hypothetical protein